MKTIFRFAGILFIFFFSSTISAQEKSRKLENSLLWEVSGKGLEKPSYLYGTIHMICSKDYFLSEKAKKAFDASNKLYLEINFTDPNEMSQMQQLAMGKEPLSKKLSPEQLAKLDLILKKSTGMSVQQVDSFSLLTVLSLISMKSFGCTDLKFYEMEFSDAAKKRNVSISGLETVKAQFEILENAYSNDEILKILEESTSEESEQLVTAYKNENIDSMYALTTDEKFTSEKTKKQILDNRNLNWVKAMPELMKQNRVFFAVGAGHLGGEFGVINLLRKEGYTVKPIMN
ncbi:polysaccharide biosynthesis protein GumN [Flavobacterium sp. Root935]|uniref:TraB/GumN family protein n=1 Tax=Flavobacterium sp. Root935 TaxID=1736610 RepID=UPI00070ECF28|nr:TraB/GumN family protein [Flavobacterium sp. Root935]KRD62702.1 polysaccharide biosynthesis protein GumN [Flavobacterium sp. Root935]